VQEQFDAAFAHEVEQERFVNLGIERRDGGDVIRRIADVAGRSA